jgi:hypothetical protein
MGIMNILDFGEMSEVKNFKFPISKFVRKCLKVRDKVKGVQIGVNMD